MTNQPAAATVSDSGFACAIRRFISGMQEPQLVPALSLPPIAAGVHVRRDLSAARDRLAERFPHVEFRLAEPLGPHPLLVEIVLQRAAEAEMAPRTG